MSILTEVFCLIFQLIHQFTRFLMVRFCTECDVWLSLYVCLCICVFVWVGCDSELWRVLQNCLLDFLHSQVDFSGSRKIIGVARAVNWFAFFFFFLKQGLPRLFYYYTYSLRKIISQWYDSFHHKNVSCTKNSASQPPADLLVALKERSLGFILWEPWIYVQNYHNNPSNGCWDLLAERNHILPILMIVLIQL